MIHGTSVFLKDMNMNIHTTHGRTHTFLILSTRVFLICASIAAVIPAYSWADDDATILLITSPPSETLVYSGQTLDVLVARPPGSKAKSVALVGRGGYSDIKSGIDPLRFKLAIPLNAQPGRICIRAADATPNTQRDQILTSPPIWLIIERPDSLMNLAVDPLAILAEYPGVQISLTVTALSTDKSRVYLGQSSLVSFSSSDETVARVDKNGLVTAWEPGNANIVVTYTNPAPGAPLTVNVPISVPKAIPGDLDQDGKITVNDLSVLQQFIGTISLGPNDARDLNHDGKIDEKDVEIMKTLIAEQNDKNKQRDEERREREKVKSNSHK
jgi:hypothetical protein